MKYLNSLTIKLLLLLVFSASANMLAQNPDSLQLHNTANDTLSVIKNTAVKNIDFTSNLDSLNPPQKHKTNALIRVADAFVYTAISPVRWKGKDWATAAATVGGAAVLTLVDEPIKDFWDHNHSPLLDDLEPLGFHNGKPYAAMVMTGGFYVTGWIFKSEWAKETGIILGASYLTSGALQTIMKSAVGRARPSTDVGNYKFKPFFGDPAYSSFPSGHIQIALVTSMVLARRVENPWLKGAFYAGAGVTMASRMYVDAHWFSDLVFGAAISYFCTDTVMKRLEKTAYDNPIKALERKHKISWQVNPNFRGIGIVGTF